MQSIETLTLCPGVLLDYIPTEDYKNAAFAVGFKYKIKRGCSSSDAMLSRLLFRSSRDYPTQTLFSRRLEELYSTDLSLQSSRHGDFRAALFQATFLDEPYVHGIPSFTREVLSTVAGAILRPAFDRNARFPLDAIEQERAALLDQIRAIKNHKSAYAMTRLAEITADPVRYDVPDYGTEEEVTSIAPASLARRYREMLHRSEVRFVYEGSLKAEEIAELIRELFGEILIERRPLLGNMCLARRAAHSPVLRVTEETDGKQAILALSYRLPIGFAEPGAERIAMLSAVISDAPMALLFSEVREKNGYCYSIRSTVRPSNRDLVILCGIEPGSELYVERAVSRVLSTVRTGKTDPALLKAALSYVRMAVASIFENVDATVNYVLFRRLFQMTVDLSELTDKCAAVTKEDLAVFLKKVKPDAVYLLTPKGGDQNG